MITKKAMLSTNFFEIIRESGDLEDCYAEYVYHPEEKGSPPQARWEDSCPSIPAWVDIQYVDVPLNESEMSRLRDAILDFEN